MRKSNIELLRIVSMIMVMNVHSFWAPEELSMEGVTPRIVFDFFRESTSISCVNLFVLISGYFSINWKVKSILSLVFQVYFFSLLFYFIYLLKGGEFTIKDSLLRLNSLYFAYWFVKAYLGLYVLSPVLNAFVEKKGKDILSFIVVFILLQCYYQLFGDSNFSSGYSILSFCGLYLIGRYLSLLSLDKVKVGRIILSLCISTCLITIFPLLLMLFLHKDGSSIMSGNLVGFIYNNPFVIVQSICIFLLFAKLSIQNKFINYCSSSVLAIYLLHMHPDVKMYYYDFTKSLYLHSTSYQYVALVGLFAFVFVIAVLLDKIRIKIFEAIYPLLKRNLIDRTLCIMK